LLLTASDGRLAQIWDSSTGRLVRSFDTGSSPVWAATWGAEGRRILTAGPGGGDLWSAAGPRRRLRHLPTEASQHPGAIRMSLDGRHALTPAKDGAAWLWDLTTGERTTLPAINTRAPLAFSLFSEDGVVTVWDVEGSKPKRIARLHNGGTVSSAQFSRGGEYIVTGGDDGFGRIWQVKPAHLVALLHGHTQGVRRARFSRDGTQIATVSDDGSGRLWPARPNSPSGPDWQRADSTSFSPNSRDVLLVRERRRAIWNTSTGTVLELREGGPVMDSAVNWPCGHAAGCAPWSRDGSLVAGGSTEGGAVIWNARTGVARRFGDRFGFVIEAAFSPDGRRLVLVDGNRSRAQIWRLSPEPVKEGVVPRGGGSHADVRSAQFLTHPLRVLTVDVDHNVRLTDALGGESKALPWAAYPAAVAAMTDGRVAVGTLQGKLRLFSSAGIARSPQQATNKAVRSLEFSPTGVAIAVGGQTGTTSIWNARTRKSTRLRAFGGEITGVTFSPGGDFVLVTSGDTARLWAWRLRRVLVELPRTRDVRAEFSPDGSQIVIAGKTRLEVLPCIPCLPQDELEERARSLLPAR
jgi:WD40 repeat protein